MFAHSISEVKNLIELIWYLFQAKLATSPSNTSNFDLGNGRVEGICANKD